MSNISDMFIKKYSSLILLFFICLLSISVVSASDFTNSSNDDLNLVVNNPNMLQESNDNLRGVDLITEDKMVFYSENWDYVNVTVQDKEGNAINGGSVTLMDVFGENYVVNVTNGVAEFFIPVNNTGKFNINCFYNGMGVYNNATAHFLLTVPVEDTACPNIIATRYSDTVYISGNIISFYNSIHKDEVVEGYVTVYIDGEKAGVSGLDIRGNFICIWKSSKNLIGKTINVTIVYNNSLNHFNPLKFSKTFTFSPPKDTKITYTANVIDNARTLITGIVYDEDENAVVGGSVNINDIYFIPVDSNGNFQFIVTEDSLSNKIDYEVGVFDWGSKADITVNTALMDAIRHTSLTDKLITLCKEGIPYVKFGNGNGKTIILSAGTHGGEIASQVACYNLIDLLANFGRNIDGTIYIFPAVYPEAIANNSRGFNGINMNGVANIEGTVSNNLVKFAKSVNADGLGDFHCTRHNEYDIIIPQDIYLLDDIFNIFGFSEFPGTPSVLSTLAPTPESFEIGKYIHQETGYSLIFDYDAGYVYSGAIDDNSNKLGVPAVTCEALTNHGLIEYGSVEVSFNMMLAFLKYFGFDVVEMIIIPSNGNMILKFTSMYNYNPSSENIFLSDPGFFYCSFNSADDHKIIYSGRNMTINFTESSDNDDSGFENDGLLLNLYKIFLTLINLLILLCKFMINLFFPFLNQFLPLNQFNIIFN